MADIRIHVLYKRPNADVLLDLGFIDRLQDMAEAIMHPKKKTMTLVTSPEPFNYGTFEFSACGGYVFRLQYTDTDSLRKAAYSLADPLKMMVALQKKSRSLVNAVFLLVDDTADPEAAREAINVLHDIARVERRIMPLNPLVRSV